LEQLLGIRELSEKWRIKECTIRSWVFKKRLPVIRLGRLVRFREADLNRVIEMNAEEGQVR
jgi:excisionase family DNA binding protein